MSPPGGRAPTADEYNALYQHAALLRAGHPDIEALVAVARVYRGRGVAWAAIAAAYGISADLLRDWRGAITDAAKPPVGTVFPSPHPSRTLPQRLQPSHRVAPARTILFAAGHAAPGGNDFASEAARIRALVCPHGVEVIERFNIELAELRRNLDGVRPAAVHIAAHHSDGAIALSIDSRPCFVDPEDLGRAIRTSTHNPVLAMRACCHSYQPAQRLAGNWARPAPAAETAIGWSGQVTDERASTFATQFYPYLAAGSTAGRCFTDARLNVIARWPGMAAPQIFGDASSTPLRQP
ncbi:MAG: hypothetical protein HKP61_07245 [Dactylosporangium sp.]|nr:hypothetical protein [Dactylosporangium sp.]NNJ60736.1 hypothetical protein [Dactylosporangium sp.]